MKASLILAAVLAAPALAFMPAAPLQSQPQRSQTVARAQGNVQMLGMFNKKPAAGGKAAKTFTITVQQKFYKDAEVGRSVRGKAVKQQWFRGVCVYTGRGVCWVGG